MLATDHICAPLTYENRYLFKFLRGYRTCFAHEKTFEIDPSSTEIDRSAERFCIEM